jgi:cysteine desulfurase
MSENIYLDNAATTCCDPVVIEKMLPFFGINYANPSGVYADGFKCKEAIENARAYVAALIGASHDEIYFTSGGSESDNLAIKGVAMAGRHFKNHIITTKIEHHAVINSCKALEKIGFKVSYLGTDAKGIVNPRLIENSIRRNTGLISVMFANNEIGTIEPIKEIGRIASAFGIPFHTDAVQAYGQIPINVNDCAIDLLSLSSHKLHGPKGVGALYVRKGTNIERMNDGGAQERGLRSGTENVPGIVGLGEAARLAGLNMKVNIEYVSALRNRMIERILNEIPGAILNGAFSDKLLLSDENIQLNRKSQRACLENNDFRLPGNVSFSLGSNDVRLPGNVSFSLGSNDIRLPGNVSFSFRNISECSIPMMLDGMGISASNGSACQTLQDGSSHVLRAIGVSDELAQASVRFTISHENTIEEIDYAVECLKKIISEVR